MWNVLIAEDDLKICQQLTKGLNPFAHCTLVHNGEEAIQTFQKSLKAKKPFDFILLDVTMPIMDGFEALQKIRGEERKAENASAAEVFVIMITSYADSLMNKINMGWDDFITKPVEIEKLISHMHRLMGNAVVE